MTQPPPTYNKFPGKWLTLIAKRSLWQGPDHLLWVEGGMIRETYKRFYYKDIQALVLCRSNGRTIWTILWFLLLLLSGTTAFLVSGPPYVSSILAVTGACCLILNLLKGPTCNVYLQTAVQNEKLTTLVRERKAFKILDRIKALSQSAQGNMDLSGVVLDGGRFSSVNPGFVKPASSGTMPDAAMKPYNPLLHWILFSSVALLGCMRGAQVVLKWLSLAAMDTLGLVCTLILFIAVLVRSHRPVQGSLVAMVDWLMLVYFALHSAAAYVFLIVASLKNPAMSYDLWAVTKAYLQLQTADHAVVKVYTMGFAAVSLILGILGIIGIILLGGRLRGPAAVSARG